jgi:hypothetical protein
MIDCKSRPVIFPKLARKCIISEGRFVLTGRKRADFKLLELLISADDLPHIMVWDAARKDWDVYPDGTVLQLMDDVFVNYDYEKLLSYEDSLLLSWLNLYSSAAFTISNSRNNVALDVS